MDSLQTLSEFVSAPFGASASVTTDYSDKYMVYSTHSNMLNINSILDYSGHYFYHFKLQSESDQKVKYDVVIEFTPPTDKSLIKNSSLSEYYVRFFSNSPGFVYKYAALYKASGYLIESLAEKLGDGINTMPTKTNAEMTMMWDKSIYIAAKYLSNFSYKYGWSNTLSIKRTRNISKFLKGISSFDEVNISLETNRVVRSIDKGIADDNKKLKDEKKKQKASGDGYAKIVSPTAKKGTSTSSFAKVTRPKTSTIRK